MAEKEEAKSKNQEPAAAAKKSKPKVPKYPFTRWGAAVLHEPTKPVEMSYLKTGEFRDVTNRMIAKLKDTGWGLAANQIGLPLKMALVWIEPIPKHPEFQPLPPTFLINPTILERSEELQYGWEGCLSCPGVRFYIPRPEWIKVKYTNQNGEEIQEQVEGLWSVLYSHEIDHLYGRVCGERVMTVNGEVVQGAIVSDYEYFKNPRKVPMGALGLVKSEEIN